MYGTWLDAGAKIRPIIKDMLCPSLSLSISLETLNMCFNN